jgi:outer membrane protein assembly factor BamC
MPIPALHRKSLGPIVLGVMLVLLISGCSSPRGEKATGPIYEPTRPGADSLELPPDLLAPGVDQSFRIPGATGERFSARELDRGQRDPAVASTGAPRVLPASTTARINRDGTIRWISLEGQPEAWWPRLREFWRTQNLMLLRDEPAIGIMETEWAENRAGLPLSGAQNLLARLAGTLYDAGTRDQYRLRVDTVDSGTEIFLTHRGAIERPTGDDQGWRWTMTDGDRSLEAEMLNRLFVFLTTGEVEPASRQIAEFDFERTGQVDLTERDGRPALVLRGDPEALWRRLGIGLDRVGLVVDEQNRAQGVFRVTYRPDLADDGQRRAGPIRRFFGTRGDRREGDRFELHMRVAEQELVVEARAIDGGLLSASDARFVLERIQPQLR